MARSAVTNGCGYVYQVRDWEKEGDEAYTGHPRPHARFRSNRLESPGVSRMKAVKIVLATLIGALFVIACLAFYGLYVPGSSFTGPPPPLSDEQSSVAGRLRSHISAIASEPHNVEHPAALERSAQAVEKAFTDTGYKVQRQTYRSRGVAVRNIWVTLEPAKTDVPIETIVVGGHYDSAHDAPGANDNASGTAATIELARLLKSHNAERTRIHFVAFVNEESPFWGTPDQGAQRFVELLQERGETVRGMLSLETLGWFSNDSGSQRYPAPLAGSIPMSATSSHSSACPGLARGCTTCWRRSGSTRRSQPSAASPHLRSPASRGRTIRRSRTLAFRR